MELKQTAWILSEAEQPEEMPMLDPNIPLAVHPPPPFNVLQSLGDVMALKNQQAVQQMNQIKLDEARQQQADKQALDEAWRYLGDRKAILQSLATSGHGSLTPGIIKTFSDWDTAEARLRQIEASTTKTQSDLDIAQADVYGSVAYGIKGYLDGPDKGLGAATIGLADLYRRGRISAEQRDQLLQQFKDNPDSLRTTVDQLIAHSKTYSTLASQDAARQATANRPIPVGAYGNANPVTGRMVIPAPERPRTLQAKSVLLDDKPAMVNFDPRTGKYEQDGQDVTARVKPIPLRAAVVGPAGLTRAQAGVIERNFQFRLDQLERRYQTLGLDRTDPIIKAQMDAEKLKIYNSYLVQRGNQPVDQLPSEWAAGKPKTSVQGKGKSAKAPVDPEAMREAKARGLMLRITQKKQAGEDFSMELAELKALRGK